MGRDRIVLATAVALLAAPAALLAQPDGASPPPAPPAADVTAAQRDAAIAKGVAFLDEKLWTLDDQGSPQKQYAAAVAGWAYLLLEAKPPTGVTPRAKAIDRIADYLARYEEQAADVYATGKDKKPKRPPAPTSVGAIPLPGMLGVVQFVWPLSQDAHFRGEALLRGRRAKESKEALGRVVQVLEASQQPDGGWGHDDASKPGMGVPLVKIPLPGGVSLTYPKTFMAASHCALAGLGAAERALGVKSAKSLDRGRAYFAGAQNSDGTFEYDPSQKDVTAGVPRIPDDVRCLEIARTGGAAFALLQAGATSADPVVAKCLTALEGKTHLLSEGHGSATLALEYGALLCNARGPERWAEFRRIFFPRIVAAQTADGSFDCVCKHAGFGVSCDTNSDIRELHEGQWATGARVYVTAIHVLVLAMDREAPKIVPSVGPAAPTTPK